MSDEKNDPGAADRVVALVESHFGCEVSDHLYQEIESALEVDSATPAPAAPPESTPRDERAQFIEVVSRGEDGERLSSYSVTAGRVSVPELFEMLEEHGHLAEPWPPIRREVVLAPGLFDPPAPATPEGGRREPWPLVHYDPDGECRAECGNPLARGYSRNPHRVTCDACRDKLAESWAAPATPEGGRECTHPANRRMAILSGPGSWSCADCGFSHETLPAAAPATREGRADEGLRDVLVAVRDDEYRLDRRCDACDEMPCGSNAKCPACTLALRIDAALAAHPSAAPAPAEDNSQSVMASPAAARPYSEPGRAEGASREHRKPSGTQGTHAATIPSAAPAPVRDGARELHLQWNGTEYVDDRCGCRYHPDDDSGSHSGAPHVHLCARHSAAPVRDETGLLNALTQAAVSECERAVRQARGYWETGLSTAAHGGWGTCFRVVFEKVFREHGYPPAAAAPAEPTGEVERLRAALWSIVQLATAGDNRQAILDEVHSALATKVKP